MCVKLYQSFPLCNHMIKHLEMELLTTMSRNDTHLIFSNVS